MHAPFESCLEDQENISENIQVLAKNTLLAHGKAVKVIRENAKRVPKIGLALNGKTIFPRSSSEKDIEDAKNKMFVDDGNVFGLNFWADPIILGFNGAL